MLKNQVILFLYKYFSLNFENIPLDAKRPSSSQKNLPTLCADLCSNWEMKDTDRVTDTSENFSANNHYLDNFSLENSSLSSFPVRKEPCEYLPYGFRYRIHMEHSAIPVWIHTGRLWNFIWKICMNIHTFHTWGCKNEEKKKSIKPPFLKRGSVWFPVPWSILEELIREELTVIP
jgi:hypothetical protein